MRALQPVPDAPLRALALIRVSREREGMISPELQETAIGDYCTRNGMQIVERMEGLDESGSRARSRWWARLDAAVKLVEDGQVDVIVVWKFSRTARHRLRWAVALDRVETAGGRLESATEQVDVSTSTGRFTRGMLAELNAFEAERIGEQWKETHARRVSLGLPATGGDRFGYVRDGETYTPDPAAGPVLAGMYADFIAGVGFQTIARRLNAAGVTTLAGGQWTTERVTAVLDSGFAAGLLSVGKRDRIKWFPGAHLPVVDAATWEAFREARRSRRVPAAESREARYPLSGLLRCGDCGASMHATAMGQHAGYGFVCSRWAKTRTGVCVTVSRAKAERAVLDWLGRFAADIEAAAVLEAGRQAQRVVARTDATHLRRQALRLDERLTKLTIGWTDGLVPDGAYEAAKRELTGERDRLTDAARQAEEQSQSLARPSAPLVTALLESWDTKPAADIRAMLRPLVAAVVVERSDVVRVRVVPVED